MRAKARRRQRRAGADGKMAKLEARMGMAHLVERRLWLVPQNDERIRLIPP